MKISIYSIVFFSLFLLFSFACEDESNKENHGDTELELTSEILNNPSCKNGLKSTSTDVNTPDSLSCVQYEYDADHKKLTLLHVNAGFNCCTEGFAVETTLKGNTITIKEVENEALCNCNCLYDLEIEIEGVEAKEYTLHFVEPYTGDMLALSFTINLANSTTGSFCTIRKNYPWNIGSTETFVITGGGVEHSGCKNEIKNAKLDTGTPDSLSCISYTFDKTNNTLLLHHINACFNCCPGNIYIEVSTESDTIIIQEIESKSECDCNCLYDLSIKLEGVEEKKYQLVIKEPYINSEKELFFELDLTTLSEGEYCVVRKAYPWGL